MKTTVYPGVSLLLFGPLTVLTMFAQATPDGLYTAFYSEKDAAKKVALGEQFINNPGPSFKSSQYLPYIFQTVFDSYVSSRNVPKTLDTADKLGVLAPMADNKLKTFVYSQAMVVAYQASNSAKTVELADKLLAADPNNLNALMVVPPSLLLSLPVTGPARDAALTKAQEYSRKLLAAPKPSGVGDADWLGIQSQAHASVGQVLLTRNQNAEAAKEFVQALKLNPKDEGAYYQLGVAYSNQVPAAQKLAFEAYTAENNAKSANADQLQIDELAGIRDALQTDFRTKRDMALDAFAKAVALAGPNLVAARKELARLYKSRNNDSLEGLDQLIAQKKAEL